MLDMLFITTGCHPKAWYKAACHIADVRNCWRQLVFNVYAFSTTTQLSSTQCLITIVTTNCLRSVLDDTVVAFGHCGKYQDLASISAIPTHFCARCNMAWLVLTPALLDVVNIVCIDVDRFCLFALLALSSWHLLVHHTPVKLLGVVQNVLMSIRPFVDQTIVVCFVFGDRFRSEASVQFMTRYLHHLHLHPLVNIHWVDFHTSILISQRGS